VNLPQSDFKSSHLYELNTGREELIDSIAWYKLKPSTRNIILSFVEAAWEGVVIQ
jgi:hypothetical protein